MTQSDVDRIFSGLAGQLGMPGLCPDQTGLCQLVFDQRHVVRIAVVPARSALVLDCSIGSRTVDADSACALLRANHLRGAEGDCLFSISPQGLANVHCIVGTESALSGNLLAAIENLLNEVERWEAHLLQGAAQAALRTPASLFMQTV